MTTRFARRSRVCRNGSTCGVPLSRDRRRAKVRSETVRRASVPPQSSSRGRGSTETKNLCWAETTNPGRSGCLRAPRSARGSSNPCRGGCSGRRARPSAGSQRAACTNRSRPGFRPCRERWSSGAGNRCSSVSAPSVSSWLLPSCFDARPRSIKPLQRRGGSKSARIAQSSMGVESVHRPKDYPPRAYGTGHGTRAPPLQAGGADRGFLQ